MTSVLLTDAPFPYDGVSRVDVYVSSISLAPQKDTAEGLPGWIKVANPERTFNLLDLQNGTTALLGASEVPAGQYQAVQVVVDPARSSITLDDGTVLGPVDGTTGPGIDWQSKAEHPSLFAMVEDPVAISPDGEQVVIDFDVGRSFRYDGANHFTFVPWLRAISSGHSGAVAGSAVRADGSGPIARAAVEIHLSLDSGHVEGPLAATTRTAADGSFRAAFLRPGSYHVVVEDLAREVTSDPVPVQVTAGTTADVGALEF
jgi:hypothetical protein